MKVFISHTFSERDQKLSSEFNQYLNENKINGYLAEQRQEYTILISDKIKNEIKSSDYLVAIITMDGLISASVHEEIGFAIGKDIPIILMVEETLEEKGVLIYGKEPEYFKEVFFKFHSKNVIKYIQNNKYHNKSQNSQEFLNKRNLLDVNSSEFAKNIQTELLHTSINENKIPHGKPYVLFSSCPNNLKDFADVHTKKFQEFVEKHNYIKIQNNKVHFLDGDKKIYLDSISYIKHRRDDTVSNYSELQNNGFIEQGFSDYLIHQEYTDDIHYVLLHHCWLTGAFWAFLKFSKIYYENIEMTEKFDVMLSIHNSRDLMLHGFGGQIRENVVWSEPYSSWWESKNKPRTTLDNIQLRIESIEIQEMNDDFIESEVRKISNKIAYAYGLESAMCYNNDNSFNWELMSYYN